MAIGAEPEQFSRPKRQWPGGGISAKPHPMKNTHIVKSKSLKTFLSASVLTLISASALARSPMTPPSDPAASVAPKGLSCEATVQLPSGKTQKGPAQYSDHLMFGPHLTAVLVEGGNSTAVPWETAGFIALIAEDKKNGLVVLNIEAKVNHTVFEPTLTEQFAMSKGSIVLSRKVKGLSKGTFSLASVNLGSVLIECDLK